jgi:hypothetical protein
MRRIPSFDTTSTLVARALGISRQQLHAAFRPATEADLLGVIDLRRTELASEIWWDDAAYLKWRYHFGDPTRGRGDCWVFANDTGIILGIVGTEETELETPIGACSGLILMDILVRKDFRGTALGPWMNMALQARYDCTMAFGSNRNSRSMVNDQFTFQQVLRTYALYLRSNLVLRRRIDIPLLTSSGAFLSNVGLEIWRIMHQPKGTSAIRIEYVTNLDKLGPAVDTWPRPRDEIGRRRSRDFLNWRVCDNPRSRFEISIAWRGETIVAYLITQNIPQLEGSALHLIDWRTSELDQDTALRALVASAVVQAKRAQCTLVAASVLHEGSASMLRKMGFIARGNRISFAYSSKAPHPLHDLQGPRWHLTTLDGDVDSNNAT